MIIKVIPVGMLRTNSYLVMDEDTKEAIVIDPGSRPEKILAEVTLLEATVKYIVFTHGHYDHIVASHYVQEATGAQILMHRADVGYLPQDVVAKSGRYTTAGYVEVHADRLLEDSDTFDVGNLKFSVLSTPGHTNGSICLVCGDALFSGDTLFKGTCGRCDLVDGNFAKMLSSLKKLAQLPGDYRVFPGHEAATTLNAERSGNEFVAQALEK